MSTKDLIARLADLAVFARVVECGGFSAAARQLGVTPSAVSRQVSRLEATLGSRLLERSTRHLRLSEAGAQAYAHCREMLVAAQAAGDAAASALQTPSGLLRVGMPKALGRRLVHPRLPAFLDRHPQVDVQLSLNDYVLDPYDSGLDLVVRPTDQPPPGLAARRLMHVRHVLCASPAYLEKHGTPAEPAQLATHHCIYLGERPGDDTWHFIRGDDRVDVKVRGRYAVNHSEARLEAACNGLGIATLPDFVARDALAAGALRSMLTDWTLIAPYQGPVWALYLPSRYQMPRLRVFIDFLVEILGPPTAC